MTTSRTIVAPATVTSQNGAIGIVRLSGEEALNIAMGIFSCKALGGNSPEPRRMYLGTVTTENFKDKAFCVYCKAPISYTGEDVVEFHLHGGRSLIQGVVRELVALGARPAEPGEFTRRAFLNGKMTLAEAEGVADIINAESEAGIMQAYRMMSGETSKSLRKTAEKLLMAEASAEVALDYPEELLEDTKPQVLQILKEVQTELCDMLSRSAARRMVSGGATVALAGLTNVGKSSIMNALLRDERAIVTEIPGTTRDTLKEQLEIKGLRINLIDTAGIRDAEDRVEQIGIDRAKKAIDSADCVLFIKDLSAPETPEEVALLSSLSGHGNLIVVGNKSDTCAYMRSADIYTSAVTGEGIEKLINEMLSKLKIDVLESGTMLTRERHIFAAKEALTAVNNALSVADIVTPDCLIEDIREAYRALSAITGEDVNESVVDKIFSEFCVGK